MMSLRRRRIVGCFCNSLDGRLNFGAGEIVLHVVGNTSSFEGAEEAFVDFGVCRTFLSRVVDP